eukprot:6909748-Prymnesium_polylepis.1
MLASGAAESNDDEPLMLAAWQRAASHWSDFDDAFALHPSSRNEAALRPLRLAAEELAGLLQISALGEFRGVLVLSKLVQAARMLTQDEAGMRQALEWHTALVETPLCAGLYASSEGEPSCFNDQLVAAITLARRLNETITAQGLVALGRSHPAAATHWASPLQTPRIFRPALHAAPWWDASRFPVATALEAAWASGALAADIARLGIEHGDRAFDRIVLNGEQVKSASTSDDMLGAGAWSEWKLYDGVRWDEERCALLRSTCAVLR